MFSRMTHEDKLAFFELLDEYFESRPHIFSRESENGGVASQPAAVAANAVHRTMAANPQATADVVSTGLKSIPKGTNPQATADLISTGLKNIPKGSQYSAASNPVVANAAGRFAASGIASSYGGGAKSPPAPPRRNAGTTDESPSPSRAGPAGLLSSKRFGDVDTSSITSVFTSSFKGGKPAPAPASSTLPPALDSNNRRNFAPPPVRRVPTNTSSEGDASAEPKNKWGNQNQGPVRRVPSHNTLQRQPTPEPEPAQGELAEALYDYNSSAAEDISVRQGDRFLVVERTSDDWWTAAFTSSFKGGKPAPAPASSTLPPALDNGSRRNFAPPPVRRVPTNTSSEGDAGAEPKNNRGNQNQGPVRRVPSHNTLQRQPTPEPEHAQGEPAEALYDYNSSAAEDINVRQGDRFIVVERTSDDWWTGEINGRRGLLPASYVRLL
ncbi:unnamed protein product [Rhizoctonia solani]|uniref:SH3 domain-containing protein n=1 Tax=Rhizoctonia solani TaxID=456999 RepID=A0A8H3CRH7_9AGAM|nr:unnamed protein product [Rhizoctonia solani]